MQTSKFQEIVQEAIDKIPQKYKGKIENVAFLVVKSPTPALLNQLNIRPGTILFGLYQGIPQTKRGAGYTLVPPDKITIFQDSIEAFAKDEKEIIKLVKNTIMHEIGHHFGADEARIRAIELKKNN